MKKTVIKKRTWVIIVFAVVIICSISGVSWLYNLFVYEKQIDSYELSYSINSDTILDELRNGNTDVFTIRENETSEVKYEYIEWEPEDYLLVAEAALEIAWREPADRWQIKDITYVWDCKNLTRGPQWAFIDYVKIVKIHERESKFLSYIYLYPLSDEVVVWKEEWYPKIKKTITVDPNSLEITPDDALNIAEGAGGYETRELAENECTIDVSLTKSMKSWMVYYDVLGINGIIETTRTFYIDAKSGEIKGQ